MRTNYLLHRQAHNTHVDCKQRLVIACMSQPRTVILKKTSMHHVPTIEMPKHASRANYVHKQQSVHHNMLYLMYRRNGQTKGRLSVHILTSPKQPTVVQSKHDFPNTTAVCIYLT